MIDAGIGANSASVTGYNVENSTAFDRTRTEYYTRDVSSTGNRDVGTISMWIKRGRGDLAQYLFTFGNTDNDNGRTFARFQVDNTLWIGGGSTFWRKTSRVFRDFSAWYHIVIAFDTTQSTANDRIKLYVNGVQETSFSATANPSQNDDLGINFEKQVIGYNSVDNGQPYDGNICEVVIQDGVASAPTEFGEFDEDTGIWIPIDPSGVTFGTNGAYLNFADSGTMGNDASGGTDFTGNNLNSTDLSEDTCTNNFATWDYNTGYLQGDATAFTGGNLIRQGGGSAYTACVGTIGINPFSNTNKWYFEIESSVTINGSSNEILFGLISTATMLAGSHANTNVYSGDSGNFVRYASQSLAGEGTLQGGGIVGILLECGTTPVFKIYKNDSLVWTKTHGSGVTFEDEFYFPYVAAASTSLEVIANFGNPIQEFAIASGNSDPNGYGNFEFSTKSGYAWCSKNLAEHGG
jgi:hypothetical protein